jgi:hypothetical protein
MSQVVSELVIDANTSGADDYTRAMQGAEDATRQTMGTVAGMSVAIAGVGVAVVGVVAGLRAFIDYVGAQSQALVDYSDHAALAGVSTREFQQTLFAARSMGLTDKDFVSGLDKITADLTAAGQGVTQFSKLFEANGISIRQQNGELITTRTALIDIMGLMRSAAPDVQQKIADIVGVSKSWIPFLKEGADQFAAQKQAAADLGVIIDDSTIRKAAEFNSQWKTAVATWDLQFKASLASILPLLTQMATLAGKIIDGIGAASGSVGRWMTPDEDKTKAQLNDQINDVYRLRELVDSFGNNAGGIAGLKIANLKGLLGLPEDASLAQVDQLIDKLAALYDKKPTQLTVNATGRTTLPANDSAGDAVDRAINSLAKHTEQQLADVKAVGLGDAALAGFKAEAAETAAVMANHGKETDAQAQKFRDLRDAAIGAADALAKAKVNSAIEFGGRTALLSSGDVAIAQQLKGIYGNDVTAAINSADAAQLRFNAGLREASSAIESGLVTGLTDITSGAKSASQGFSDMGNAVAKAIEQMIIKIAIVTPLMQALQAAAGGLGLGTPGIAQGQITLGNAAGPSPFPSAQGNLFDGGNVIPFARGGVVDSPTIVPMALMGEKGPEAIVPLRRGADGNLGVASQGGGSAPVVNVTLIETAQGGGGVTQKQNSNGGIDIEVAIAQITARSAATPGGALNRVMTDQLGARQRLASR